MSASAREPRLSSQMDVPLVGAGSGSAVGEEVRRERRSPEATAGCWYTLTFGWLGGVIAEGYKREKARQRNLRNDPEVLQALTEADLLELRPDDRPEFLMDRAEEAWSAEEMHGRHIKRALRVAFGGTFFVAGVFKLVYDSLQMVGPYVLKNFLAYLKTCEVELDEGGSCDAKVGYEWVGIILVSSLLQTAVLHQYFHRCFRTGMRLNAATIALIYKKALKIAGPGKLAEGSKPAANGAANGAASGAANGAANGASGEQPRQQRTTGEIVNLMSVDAQRIQDTMTYLHTLWSGPYQIIITLVFLFQVVHWATLAGLGIMLLQIPLVSLIARRVRLAQRALMKIKDERIKVTNEVFGSVKLLKMYAWEVSFEEKISEIRAREMKQLRKYQLLNIISSTFYSVAPILTGVATFGVYTWLYGELGASTAFTALSLFNVLRFPLTMFPNMVTSAVEANVAFKRIDEFLTSPEIRGRPAMPPPLDWNANADKPRPAIHLQNAKFEWPGGIPLLGGVTFSVPRAVPNQEKAHLTVVIGSVGVGKSGLLQALIGDLSPSEEGSMEVAGSIAYSSQVAWIRNATVKDNIIFNHPYDEERYNNVVKACQLLPDFEALPNGEATEIGEKGVNLSGGQKQRVSLARAVYAKADILLLDDPLSAVDSEVAKKLMRMLRGPLVQSSSIVLCTHYLGAVSQADQVIVLERKSAVRGTLGNGEEGAPSQEGGGEEAPSTAAYVAFCGSPEEYGRKFPDMASHAAEKMVRQDSEEAKPPVKQDNAAGDSKAAAGRTVQAETELTGSVSWKVYKTYIDAAGGFRFALLVLLGLLVGQACQTGADTWVSFWSDHSMEKRGEVYVSSEIGLIGYATTSFAAFFGVVGTSTMFRITALKAARSFHEKLLASLLKLPMSFYDTTPLGRVLNRFSKDIYTVDEQLVSILMMYFQTLCRVLATLLVITWATPWFLAIVVPLLLVYRYVQNFYVPSSRQLKRIESNLRSPIFSHFSETLDGVASIRAFGQQRQFVEEILGRVQRNMRAYYLNVSSNRWLAIRLETIGTTMVFAAGLLAVIARNRISAGVAGLSISYALAVTQSLNWVVRMTSDRETNIISVERLSEYIAEQQEPPRALPGDPAPGSWPLEGAISFNAVKLQYRPTLPFVLNGLYLDIKPREKLGICGRTGAGKSSLLNVLLRIVDPSEGSILIDGVDVGTLGLHTVRRSITVLPQDPVMFSGSLRFNLDPLGESTDDAIWKALERAHLCAHAEAVAAEAARKRAGAAGAAAAEAAAVSVTKGECLDASVAEKGENFSLGQRQQACLARALLRSNKILLLDEATSAVDVETDSLIQETIRTDFAEHTVLCIAHRISTVMTSDRICVVDAGTVAELGSPSELLERPGSHFARLARNDNSR